MIPAQVRTLVPGSLVVVPVAASLIAELLAWALLWAWRPGPGWYGQAALLASVHLITVGTLALALLGMGWQLVPVATGTKPRPGWNTAARIINGVAITGAVGLIGGMLAARLGGLAIVGATLIVLALLSRSIVVLREVLTAEGRPMIRAWIVLAEVSLWAGLGYGVVLLSTRVGHPLTLLNPFSGIATHVTLLLLGWVGGWIVAMASILVPMFLVSPEPRSELLAVSGLLWFGGIAMGLPSVWFAGTLVFVAAMGLSLVRRVRRKISPDLRVALAGILGLVGVAALLILRAQTILAVIAALTVFALPVLHGVGLRIIPFLFWAYGFANNVKDAPMPESLSAPTLARTTAYGSMFAGVLLIAGYASSYIWVWRIGTLLGGISAATYLGAIALTGFRTWQAHNRLLSLPGTEAT